MLQHKNKTKQTNEILMPGKTSQGRFLLYGDSSVVKFREIGWGRVVIKGRRRDGGISDGDEEEGSGNAGDGLHTTQMYLILHTESG